MIRINIFLILFCLVLFSCENATEQSANQTIDVQFGYEMNSRSKAVNKTPAAVVMTIKQGATTIHQDLKLPVTNFNGNIVTQPFALKVGNYSITDYKIVNAGDTVIYATPVEGSTAARLVTDALEINFTVSANGNTVIKPEVLDVEAFTPEEFGYPSGGFAIVPTFHFLISVNLFNTTTGAYQLTDAQVEVKSGNSIDFNEAIGATTKAIEVRDEDSTYTLKVTKTGYLDWIKTYTNTEMKAFDGKDAGETPLQVVLQKDPNYGLVSTFAGSTQGYADGTGVNAKFFNPYGIDVDASGNIYVVDLNNHKIRKITPAGVVTTLAGSTQGFADGNGSNAKFNTPTSLEVDAAGNVYVMDFNNHRVRKITPSGDVTTIAGSGVAGFVDGVGTSAQFNYARGLAIDGAGNIYIGDTGNYRIRKITPAGVVSTLAGSSTQGLVDGNAGNARIMDCFELTVDGSGVVYFTDGHTVRKLTPSGDVTTIAGSSQGFADGNGTSAKFNTPTGIDIDASGVLYVMEQYGQRARRISTTGDVISLAGTGVAGSTNGEGSVAQFSYARGIVVDHNGHIYIADEGNNRIRKISF